MNAPTLSVGDKLVLHRTSIGYESFSGVRELTVVEVDPYDDTQTYRAADADGNGPRWIMNSDIDWEKTAAAEPELVQIVGYNDTTYEVVATHDGLAWVRRPDFGTGMIVSEDDLIRPKIQAGSMVQLHGSVYRVLAVSGEYAWVDQDECPFTFAFDQLKLVQA